MRGHEAGNGAKLPPVLIRFWKWTAGLTALSWAYTLIMTYVFKASYPYGLPYFLSTDEPFWDLTVFADRFHHFRQPSFWDTWNFPLTYPAPMGVVIAFFYQFRHPVRAYVVVWVVGLIAGAWLVVKELAARGISPAGASMFVVSILAMCWPLHYFAHRENIEGVVAIILTAGILAAIHDRWWLAATLIGVAGSMKIYPLALLCLLLSRRRYKEFTWGFLTAAIVTLGSLQILGPNVFVAQRNISAGLLYFKEHWAAHVFLTGGAGFDHSLFEFVKIPVAVIHGYTYRATIPKDAYHLGLPLQSESPALTTALNAYMLLITLSGVALYFLRIRKLPMLNQVLALSICAILFPPVSFDYTLVHLLTPLGLLCICAAERWRRGEHTEGLSACFVCFALIMTVESYVSLHWRLAGEFRAIILVVLLTVALRYPFRSQETAIEVQAT